MSGGMLLAPLILMLLVTRAKTLDGNSAHHPPQVMAPTLTLVVVSGERTTHKSRVILTQALITPITMERPVATMTPKTVMSASARAGEVSSAVENERWRGKRALECLVREIGDGASG